MSQVRFHQVVTALLVAGCAVTNELSTPEASLVAIDVYDAAAAELHAEQSAISYAMQHASAKLGNPAQFSIRSVAKGADDAPTHVRLEQTEQGLPIWGADVVVHMQGGKVLGMNGQVAKLTPRSEVIADLSDQDALQIGQREYASHAASQAGLQVERAQARLMLYPSLGDTRLVYHVLFSTELQAGLQPGRWNYLVDAQTGEILSQWNGLHTLSQASGPGGNAKVARQWTNALDVEASSNTYVANTARLITYNLKGATSGGTLASGTLSNFGDAAINDAHGFAEITLGMLASMGHNSINDAGFAIKSRVHYGTKYENAFWDGTQMTYGDGASTFFALSGDLDVVAHEINHGFTEFHSALVYSGQSGGLNESFSDIAGTAAEFFHEGTAADWDIGRDIFRTNNALRFMCNPTLDGVSIDHFSSYTSAIDVHFSSGIGNKAFCLAARRLGSGSAAGTATPQSVARAAKAWFEANANYWTSSATFAQGCQGVVDAAATLGYSSSEVEALRQSWADVGVQCTPGNSNGGGMGPAIACDQTLTSNSGTITSPNFPNDYGNNASRTICLAPANGAPTTLTFGAFHTEANYDFVTIFDSGGTQLAKASGTTAPAALTRSFLAVKFVSDTSVTASGWSATWGSTSNQPPSVTITSPSAGTVGGVVTVTANATDIDGTVARVRFTLPNGTTIDDSTAPFATTWNSSTVANGTGYVISAVAFDNAGAQSTNKSVTVAVQNATTACTSGTFTAANLPVAIPDNNSTGVTAAIAIGGGGKIATLALSAQLTHTYRGDLRVTLVGPNGSSVVLHDQTGGSADNLVFTNQAVTAFTGQPTAGTWRLVVQDLAAQDVGSVTAWSLTTTCTN